MIAPLAVIFLCYAPFAKAAAIPPNDNPGFLSAPIRKVTQEQIGTIHMPGLNIQNHLVGGPPGYLDTLSNQRYYYLTEVQIGTPPQKLDLLLDTGSSDCWVYTANTQARGSPKTTVFDSSASKSFKPNGTSWTIQYGKGSASGQWGMDTFKIGTVQLKHLSIGLADKVNSISQGLLGIGRPQAEITYSKTGAYYNLPLEMKHEGLINSAAYSLALGNLNDAMGNIIFGGIDYDQFVGNMAELPITHPKHMGVTVRGMKLDKRATYELLSGKSTVAILDSGTSLSYLDSGTLESLQTGLNANPSFTIGMKYYTDCNITKHLNIDYGDVVIPVPAYDFLWPIDMFVDTVTAHIAFPPNSCYVGIESSAKDEDFLLFGDNFLRQMYIVYDITDSRIGIAIAKRSSGTPNVHPIVPGQPLHQVD